MRSQSHRAVSIALAGMVLSVAAMWASQKGTGLFAAAAFMVAAAALPVTIGVAISYAAGRDRGRSGFTTDSPRHTFWARFRGPRVADLTRCTGCGRHRELAKTVLVCARCDLSPAVN